MSRIEELIKEKCPDGVEYKLLYEITYWDKKFNGIEKFMQPQVIDYHKYFFGSEQKELESVTGTVKILTTYDSDIYADEEVVEEYITDAEIVCIPWGGNAIVQYYKGKFITGDNRIATSRDIRILDNKYLYYVLCSQLDTIKKYYRGAGIQHPDMFKILTMEIPVPPIEVQQEIVRILDKFIELEAELQVELNARKKQYEYYRDSLMTFDENVPVVRLDEISDIYDSLHTTPAYKDTGYSMIRVADVKSGYVDTSVALKVDEETYKQYIKKYKPQFNDIIISRVGSFGNTCLIGNEDVCLGQNIALIHSKISAKYLYYYLNTSKVRTYFDGSSNGAAYKNLSLARIKETPIAVPDIETQNKIVAVLEKLDAISADTEMGLPAEIINRRKQYEYYRDKLLTFERKVV